MHAPFKNIYNIQIRKENNELEVKEIIENINKVKSYLCKSINKIEKSLVT
jgi:hypothetical protein